MENRLDILVRKNKGKRYLDNYLSVVLSSGLSENEIVIVELEETDTIIEMAKLKFQSIDKVLELLPEKASFIDSELLSDLYLNLEEDALGYLYTDAYQYCGIFKVKAKRCLEVAFSIAKNDFQNTCFVLDSNLRYSLLINYTEQIDDDYPCTFDVQLWLDKG